MSALLKDQRYVFLTLQVQAGVISSYEHSKFTFALILSGMETLRARRSMGLRAVV